MSEISTISPISEAKRAANRRNALKSTGPRTAAGKAIVRMNGTRHGLTGQVTVMTEEDREPHTLHCAEILAELQPVTYSERRHAMLIAEDMWRLQRLRDYESSIVAMANQDVELRFTVDHPEMLACLSGAKVFFERSGELQNLSLYDQRIMRAVEKNRAALKALQKEREAAEQAALDKAMARRQLEVLVGDTQAEAEAAAPPPSTEPLPDLIPAGPAQHRIARRKVGFAFSSSHLDAAIREANRADDAKMAALYNWNPPLNRLSKPFPPLPPLGDESACLKSSAA